MSDLSVAMLCVTALAVATLAYHAFRKHLDRVGKSELGALSVELQEQLTNLQLATHKRDGELAQQVVDLREDNKAEFMAMKTAFDRATSREALATAVTPRGPNARQY